MKGPKGELSFVAADDLAVSMDGEAVTVKPRTDSPRASALWGMSRTMVANLIEGVTKGFEEKLEINGVGFRAALQGKTLNLAVGYSHDINYAIPAGINIAVPKATEIVITGADRQQVGQVAAEIRAYRKPEPYQGKGVKYASEVIQRKEGKKK
jgi:large subunit ribosomal protein L6